MASQFTRLTESQVSISVGKVRGNHGNQAHLAVQRTDDEDIDDDQAQDEALGEENDVDSLVDAQETREEAVEDSHLDREESAALVTDEDLFNLLRQFDASSINFHVQVVNQIEEILRRWPTAKEAERKKILSALYALLCVLTKNELTTGVETCKTGTQQELAAIIFWRHFKTLNVASYWNGSVFAFLPLQQDAQLYGWMIEFHDFCHDKEDNCSISKEFQSKAEIRGYLNDPDLMRTLNFGRIVLVKADEVRSDFNSHGLNTL